MQYPVIDLGESGHVAQSESENPHRSVLESALNNISWPEDLFR